MDCCGITFFWTLQEDRANLHDAVELVVASDMLACSSYFVHSEQKHVEAKAVVDHVVV